MRWGLLLLSVVLGASVSRADTVFLSNASVMNGQVTYEDGHFVVQARFIQGGAEGSSRRFLLEIEAVSRVEFNRNDINKGRPEATENLLDTFGLRAPEDTGRGGAGLEPSAAPQVRVETRAGTVEHGQLVRISEQEVELRSEEGRKTLRQGEVRSISLTP